MSDSQLPAVTHRAIFMIALPIMLSNATEPLIGVVNTGVIGQLGDPALIGGVAVGSLIFSFLFWGFGFLRLSTSGLSAQATGASDQRELASIFWRSLLIALVFGAVLMALSPVLEPLSVKLMGGSNAVQMSAATYFQYRIWAAPAAFANFTVFGWFVGQGRSSATFVVQLVLNITNMVLSVVFVLHFELGVAGVGLAVLIAEYVAALLGLFLVWRRMRQLGAPFDAGHILNRVKLRALISANADMMIRTVCLLFAFAWFISRSARGGDVMVASNNILLHMFEVAAYMIDGFAYAAEALVGRAIGARDRLNYQRAISYSTVWVMAFGALCSIAILLFGPQFIDLMTVNENVRAMARHYVIWAAFTPFLGAACFLYDGIFTGAMATRDMRNMMVISLAIYLAAWWVLEPAFANHGLWAAQCVFFIARSLTFAIRLPAIKARAFQAA